LITHPSSLSSKLSLFGLLLLPPSPASPDALMILGFDTSLLTLFINPTCRGEDEERGESGPCEVGEWGVVVVVVLAVPPSGGKGLGVEEGMVMDEPLRGLE